MIDDRVMEVERKVVHVVGTFRCVLRPHRRVAHFLGPPRKALKQIELGALIRIPAVVKASLPDLVSELRDHGDRTVVTRRQQMCAHVLGHREERRLTLWC